jgi:beta-barrel assembly-enhancing protease
MKQRVTLAALVLFGIAAIFVSERRKVDVPAGPGAVLYPIADTEQELTRMPASFTRMSDADEIAIGNQLAQSYDPGNRYISDPDQNDIQNYVSSVGMRLAARAHRRLPYRFHYLRDPSMINAFALPGGHVFIGAGLLSIMDSEDELAAVLGHEIEHIDHYHCAERVQQQQALHQIPLGGLLSLPIEMFEAGYSKDQELEADREGTRLSVQAGYSPNGAIRMFEAFQRLYKEYHVKSKTPQEEITQTALDTLEGYFRSHPLPSERIAQIQQVIAAENWPVTPERDLQIAYIFWAKRSENALTAHQYKSAADLARRSLKIRSNKKALEIAAKAEFSLAHFGVAAQYYRQILDLGSPSIDEARGFAIALALTDRHTAENQFQQWVNTIKGIQPQGLEVTSAGLSLLTGNLTPAKQQAELAHRAAQTNTSAWAPQTLAELAWWYYLSGDYSSARDLIHDAVELRPSDEHFAIITAWIDIQLRQLAEANQSLGYMGNDPEKEMARAVLFWQESYADRAIAQFDAVVRSQPEWQTPEWVRAQYSPLAAESIDQMQKESEQRKKYIVIRR